MAFPIGYSSKIKSFSAEKKISHKNILKRETRPILFFFNTTPKTSDMKWVSAMFI